MKKISDTDLYNKIVSLDDLKPSSETNKAFSELVSYILNPLNKISLKDEQINNLQRLCSISEYELEKYWAQEIINSKNPQETLEMFPYFKNYEKLTQMEWYSLRACMDHKIHKILFIGSGPLPLTAIMLCLNYVDTVTVLEKDSAACNISAEVLEKIGIKDRVEIINGDAINYSDYPSFSVIFVAALAGIEKNKKEQILERINRYARPNTHILARSSWGLREIIYKPIDKESYKMFKPLLEVHPQNEIVNSVVIFAKS